jgi:tripartite-type tricarboxylate transporter receptor subunit TctC
MIARFLADPLAKILGQPVIVENMAGGTGAIGAAKVARYAPDGYTIMLGSVNENVLAPLTKPDVAAQYTAKDFTAVAKVGSSGFVIVGRKDFPAASIDDVVRLARSKPGKISFGSTGAGSMQQVVMESLQKLTDTKMLHVPYKGGAPMLTDLMGGQIDLAVSMPNIMVSQIQAKTIKAFAVTGNGRDSVLPQVPSFRESTQAPSLNYVFWFGVFGPKGIPQDRAKKLQEATIKALAEPKVIAQLRGIGVTVPTAQEQAEFPAFVLAEDNKLKSAVGGMQLK